LAIWLCLASSPSVQSLRYTAWMFFFSSRRRHTRFSRDWSSDVCSSDLNLAEPLEFTTLDQRRCRSLTSTDRIEPIHPGEVLMEDFIEGLGITQNKLAVRSEEHTSELQSRENLVCRLLLEKKNKKTTRRQ